MQNTIFVTGGASGIGLAVVEAALERGWQVVVADVQQAALESAREKLTPYESHVRCECLDVTDEAAVIATITRCDAAFGPLTGLVNSAGIGRDVLCLETSTELFRKILDVNLIGSFVVAREVARCLQARGCAGSLVNIASVSGIRGNVGRVAYGSSKAAVINMTQVMAVELAPFSIRVNAIAPGPIETPLVVGMHSAERRQQWLSSTPQHRYGQAEEVARAALFLLDERESSFITGHTLCVDGGFTAVGLT